MWKKEVIKLPQGEDLEEYLHVGVVYLTLDGKESACKAGDLGSIPGLGRSPGKATHSTILPGEFHGQRRWVQSMGSQSVRHN